MKDKVVHLNLPDGSGEVGRKMLPGKFQLLD